MERERWIFAGRAEELSLVANWLQSTGSGAVIAGRAGTGKTRLAREIAAGMHDVAVEWCVATPAAASIPFGAVAHLVPPADQATGAVTDALGRALAALRRRDEHVL